MVRSTTFEIKYASFELYSCDTTTRLQYMMLWRATTTITGTQRKGGFALFLLFIPVLLYSWNTHSALLYYYTGASTLLYGRSVPYDCSRTHTTHTLHTKHTLNYTTHTLNTRSNHDFSDLRISYIHNDHEVCSYCTIFLH